MKSFLGNFYRHLAIFFWSHWRWPLRLLYNNGQDSTVLEPLSGWCKLPSRHFKISDGVLYMFIPSKCFKMKLSWYTFKSRPNCSKLGNVIMPKLRHIFLLGNKNSRNSIWKRLNQFQSRWPLQNLELIWKNVFENVSKWTKKSFALLLRMRQD